MLNILKTRLQQGHRTTKFPWEIPTLPERYRGRPALDSSRCNDNCRACADTCPTGAIALKPLRLDLGKCLFCTDCIDACDPGAITYTRNFRMSVATRQDLVLSDHDLKLAEGMGAKLHKLLGRALRLREVCAGGCNGCDLDTNVLNTIGWDLSRFGIQFVASPRHADGLLVTGPVTRNMEYALLDTYRALPDPKIVIAVGACALSGGPFRDSPAVLNGVDPLLPVDLYIPGCPPHPLTILDGLLRLLRLLPKSAPQPQTHFGDEGASFNAQESMTNK